MARIRVIKNSRAIVDVDVMTLINHVQTYSKLYIIEAPYDVETEVFTDCTHIETTTVEKDPEDAGT